MKKVGVYDKVYGMSVLDDANIVDWLEENLDDDEYSITDIFGDIENGIMPDSRMSHSIIFGRDEDYNLFRLHFTDKYNFLVRP